MKPQPPMVEHTATKTPWHTGSTEHTELILGFQHNRECVIAELDTDDVEMATSAANATFIVEAVNSHAELTGQLQAATTPKRGET